MQKAWKENTRWNKEKEFLKKIQWQKLEKSGNHSVTALTGVFILPCKVK